MSIQEKLLPASIGGVSVIVRSKSVERGRKLSIKEYPLSNARLAEDLGAFPPIFTLELIISGLGDQYFDRYAQLINVLNRGGLTTYVDPEEGSIDIAVSTYTTITSQSQIGRTDVRVTFLQSQAFVQPSPNSNLAGRINNQSNIIFDTLKSDFQANYEISNSFRKNNTSAQDKLREIFNLFDNASRQYVNNPGFINNFYRDLTKFNEEIPRIVRDSTEIADRINSLFASSNNLGLNAQERFDFATNFFNFGNTDTPLNIPTQEIIQRNTNADLLNQYIQIGGLNQAYRNIPQIDFITDNQLEEFRAQVTKQYNNIQSNIAITQNTSHELQNNRDLISLFFKNAEESVFNITSIETKQIPLSKLSYLLYESDENYQQLIELNMIKDPSFVSGMIDILTE